MQQLLPERSADFRAYYRVDKRKEIDAQTYGIADALEGITITQFGAPVFDANLVTTTKLGQQLAILKSARDVLDFKLADIGGMLEAGLLDDELDVAHELLKAGHIRSAGVIGGVVLERHLRSVMDRHGIKTRRKPTLSNLNDALKDAEQIDVAIWRQMQHVGDIRNMCAHGGDRDPSAEEVNRLLSSVAELIKTVF